MSDHIRNINDEAPSSFPLDLPNGTPIYILPIRWWEATTPETGRYVRDGSLSGNGVRNLYIYHDGYGHEVYIDASSCFTDADAVMAEATRRSAELKRRMDEDFAAWWAAHDPFTTQT